MQVYRYHKLNISMTPTTTVTMYESNVCGSKGKCWNDKLNQRSFFLPSHKQYFLCSLSLDRDLLVTVQMINSIESLDKWNSILQTHFHHNIKSRYVLVHDSNNSIQDSDNARNANSHSFTFKQIESIWYFSCAEINVRNLFIYISNYIFSYISWLSIR